MTISQFKQVSVKSCQHAIRPPKDVKGSQHKWWFVAPIHVCIISRSRSGSPTDVVSCVIGLPLVIIHVHRIFPKLINIHQLIIQRALWVPPIRKPHGTRDLRMLHGVSASGSWTRSKGMICTWCRRQMSTGSSSHIPAVEYEHHVRSQCLKNG